LIKKNFLSGGKKVACQSTKCGFFYKPFLLSYQLVNKIWTLVSQCVWYLTIENNWLSKIDDVTISFAFYILFVTMDVEWQLIWLILYLWCRSTSIYMSIGSHIFKHIIILHIEKTEFIFYLLTGDLMVYKKKQFLDCHATFFPPERKLLFINYYKVKQTKRTSFFR
jgi:hypothetical protein